MLSKVPVALASQVMPSMTPPVAMAALIVGCKHGRKSWVPRHPRPVKLPLVLRGDGRGRGRRGGRSFSSPVRRLEMLWVDPWCQVVGGEVSGCTSPVCRLFLHLPGRKARVWFLYREVLRVGESRLLLYRVGRGRLFRQARSASPLLVVKRLTVFWRPFSVDFWSVRCVWR